MIRRFYLSLFLGRRFYAGMVGVILLFGLSYLAADFFWIGAAALGALVVLCSWDLWLLYHRKMPVQAERRLEDRLSNGDLNPVEIFLVNQTALHLHARILDELPDQFQARHFHLEGSLGPQESKTLSYKVRPTTRGVHTFHSLNLFLKTKWGLVIRRKKIQAERTVKVYPSFTRLRQFELLAHSNKLTETGSLRVRKLGHSLEFEQIKEYVRGDDVRTINWKATSRIGGTLMVNQYTDEKSQPIYCLVDQGRVMKMPFEGMTLLDYAVNATLMLSRVALVKQDKAGLAVFADKIKQFLPASHKAIQITAILESLYHLQTQFPESDFQSLHTLVTTRITQRSFLVLFTNFESMSALQRQLPYLRSLAKSHLLLVVFFQNTELAQLTEKPVHSIEDLYLKTIASKFAFEKRMIVKALQQHGISSMLTTPQDLSVDVINKYLEIKTRQAI